MKMNIIVKIINKKLNLAQSAVLTKAKKMCAPLTTKEHLSKSKYTVLTSLYRCKCITNRKY